ncbi:MAG: hypothetical protein JNL79_08600 [Myxococcales bacterium]|nr:hypothetical protein [Myxococcales bacterium]
MSWGYFLELDLTLPTEAWARIQKSTADTWPAEPGFFGLKEKGLEDMFLGKLFAGWTIGKAFALVGRRNITKAVTEGDVTRLRVVTLLDKSGDTEIARPFASLFLAAQAHGGEGRLTLVNDGTYSGEEGVVLTLAKGKVKTERVKNCWDYVERLGAELFGSFEDGAPPTKKAVTKKAATKKAAKKAVTKKAAEKAASKTATKKPSAKKTTGGETARKRP